jgi:ATP-dependent helicase HrpB
VLAPLPIDPHVAEIVRLVRERRAAVVTAAPGAGKTTRVPPALAGDGPVLLLQPRRVAARSIARRIADERGWSLGQEVGWHVRFDRHFGPDTRLLVATEGILTARLQRDPLLSDFFTVVIDEFHERTMHADLGLALARQAWIARDDLRLVVMSATLDARAVAAYLREAPVIDVRGRTHPVDLCYRPGLAPEAAVADALPRADGAVLCFLPGAPEIRRVAERLAPRVPQGIRLWPLHGGLSADEQDAAITPTSAPRVILATNLAETTVTVPDVRVVVDTGLHKVARYDAARGIDSLETERISRDSADQRTGRAGRTAPGRAVRLWGERDRLRPRRESEIARIDLASAVLSILGWGGDPEALEWFEAPPSHAVDAAIELLRRLEAIDGRGRLTSLGRDLQRLPLHPRLARLLLAARAAPIAARACAVLAERHVLPSSPAATTCDLQAAAELEGALAPHVIRAARQIRDIAAGIVTDPAAALDDETFRRAVFAGYPDRIAQRRQPGGDRFLLASGTGARLGRESGVHDAAFIVAVDVSAPRSESAEPGGEAIIRLATRIEPDWIAPTSEELEHALDGRGLVRAVRVARHRAIRLRERAAPVDPAIAAGLLQEEYLRREPSAADLQLVRRLAFAGTPISFKTLVGAASRDADGLHDMRLADHVPAEARRKLDRLAPAEIVLPGGRRVKLDYRDDGRVVAAVKLQALFGLADSPRLGLHRMPVTFELLAPNGRPVQVTSDLGSFWATGYAEVRTQLRARYPKHAWPETPR